MSSQLTFSASSFLSNAMFALYGSLGSLHWVNIGAKLSLLGENTLRCPYVQDHFLGAQEGPTYRHQPWHTRVGLFAMGKQYFGGHIAGTKVYILYDSMYRKYAE